MTTIVKAEPRELLQPQPQVEFSREQVELIKRTVCKGATDDELQLFLGLCRRSGLDPFSRQVYSIRRWDGRQKAEVMTTQVSIDGLRLIADRTGKYEGQTEPQWCARDGKWLNAWTSDEPPAVARIGVYKTGCREPIWGVARFAEYVQTDKDGHVVGLWRKMPATMLSKCAEALGLRKGFPQEMAGIYTIDELPDEREEETAQRTVRPQQESREKPWRNFKGMLDAFAELHGRLPQEHDRVYQETLREFGVEHSNQFKDAAIATDAYYELQNRVRAIEASVQPQQGQQA
jgi:phage recombination protein Bet